MNPRLDTDLLGWVLVVLAALIVYGLYVIFQVTTAMAVLTLLLAAREVLA